MKGKLQLLFIAIVAYLLGCVLRHKRCQTEWRDRHPYSYTGSESTPGPAATSIKRLEDHKMDVVKTTPVSREQTQVVEKEAPNRRKTNAASLSTEDFSIPKNHPTRKLEGMSPVHKESNRPLEKTINTIPAIPKNSKHSQPKKTTRTRAQEVTKTKSRKKGLTTPFPDDPIAGFNAFGVEWRRDEGPGKLFSDFTSQFKKDSTTAFRASSATRSTSTSEPETSSELFYTPGLWSRFFGSSKETQETQSLVSVLSSLGEAEASSKVIQSPDLRRQSESPGKLFTDFTNQLTKDLTTTTTTTESLASVTTSTSEPETLPELIQTPSWWSQLFSSSKEAQTTQSPTSVSSSTTMSKGLKDIIHSASLLLKEKTAETTVPSVSQSDVDQSSGGILGDIFDWVTGKAYPTDESKEANRWRLRIPRKFGFGTLSGTSTTSSLTESEIQAKATTSEKWDNTFRGASDIKHSTKSSTVMPNDQPETPTTKSIANTSQGMKSNTHADRKPLSELSPSTDHQQPTERMPTAEHQPTEEQKPSAQPESKEIPDEDGEENVPNEGAIKSKNKPQWRWSLGWITGTLYMPHPTFVISDSGDPPISNQE